MCMRVITHLDLPHLLGDWIYAPVLLINKIINIMSTLNQTLDRILAASREYREKNASKSNIVGELTVEQLRSRENGARFRVEPERPGKHKCFFICGESSGAVSDSLQKEFAAGKFDSNVKIIVVDKKEDDQYGKAYTGLQLVHAVESETGFFLGE